MSEKSFEQILRDHLSGEQESLRWNFRSEVFSGSQECVEFLKTASSLRTRLTKGLAHVFSSKSAVPPTKTQTSTEESQDKLKFENLDLQALSAVELFRRQGESLEFPLAEAELTAAWRRLAKKTHPDVRASLRGETAFDFQVTRDAYMLLKSQFPSRVERAA